MTKKNQLSEEYIEKVKLSVQDGSFFRDSMQWYIFQYIRPAVDRNLMIMFSLIGFFCVYYLYDIIKSSFPLVEEVPVVIREHNTAAVRPIIKQLRDTKVEDVLSADESVTKYLLSNYITQRESFDYRDSNIKEINRKFNIIKNNSSYLEYRAFRSQMSRSNPTSPIHFFGADVYKTVEISSFKFIQDKPKGKFAPLKAFFLPKNSTEAEVRFKATRFSKDEKGNNIEESKKYLAKIAFDFSGLDRNEKSGVLSFSVKKYELFEIK